MVSPSPVGAVFQWMSSGIPGGDDGGGCKGGGGGDFSATVTLSDRWLSTPVRPSRM